MWKAMTILVLLSINLTAYAGTIPRELEMLIPAGGKSFKATGRAASDNSACEVRFDSNSNTFTADLFIFNNARRMDVRRSGKFQLGFGHNLINLQTRGTDLRVMAEHGVEEQYSANTRTTLNVLKAGTRISAVQVIVEQKGWFMYKAVIDETCWLNHVDWN